MNYDDWLENERIRTDPQERPPVSCCIWCSGEIYEGEDVILTEDGLLHEDCIKSYFVDEYPIVRAERNIL